MLFHHEVVPGGDIEQVEEGEELDGIHCWVEQEFERGGLDEGLHPFVQTGLLRVGGGDGEDHLQGGAQHQEHGDHHGQHHVGHHVHGEHGRHVQANPGAHGQRQGDAAKQPPKGALPRPGFPQLFQTIQPIQVADGEEDPQGGEHDIEPPNGPHGPHGRLKREVIPHGEGHGRQVHHPRRRWRSAAQGNRNTNGGRHDEHLHDGDADKRTAISRRQARNGGGPVPPPENRQYEREYRLGHNHPTVIGSEQVFESHPDGGVDDPGNGHGNHGSGSDHGVAAHRQLQARA